MVPTNLTMGDKPQEIFHATGNKGDKWHKGDVDVPALKNPLQVGTPTHDRSQLLEVSSTSVRALHGVN